MGFQPEVQLHIEELYIYLSNALAIHNNNIVLHTLVGAQRMVHLPMSWNFAVVWPVVVGGAPFVQAHLSTKLKA